MEVAGVIAPPVLPVEEEDVVDDWAEADRARERKRAGDTSNILITTVVKMC